MSYAMTPFVHKSAHFTSIGEVGASDHFRDARLKPELSIPDNSNTNSEHFRHYGFGHHHLGVPLRNIKKLPPFEAFSSIQDKQFQRFMMHRDLESQKPIDEKAVREFVGKTLIVSAFSQEGKKSFMAALNGLITSEAVQSSPYEELLVLVNKPLDNFDSRFIDSNYLSKHGVSEINCHFYVNDNPASPPSLVVLNHNFIPPEVDITKKPTQYSEMTVRPRYDNAGKKNGYHFMYPLRRIPTSKRSLKVTVMSYHLERETDFQLFLQSNQLVSICSGDNTWIRSLEYGLFPIVQCRPYKIRPVKHYINAMSLAMPERDMDNFEVFCHLSSLYTETRAVENTFLKLQNLLSRDLLQHWPNVLQFLRTHYNFYDVLPSILRQGQAIAERQFLMEQNPANSKILALTTEIESLEQAINAPKQKLMSAVFSGKKLKLDLSLKFYVGEGLKQVLKKATENPIYSVLDLDANETHLMPAWKEVLTAIHANKNLRRLQLSNNLIEDKQLKELVESLRGIPVQYLDLSLNKISRTIDLVTFLKESTSIEHLILDRNFIDDHGILLLCSGIQQNQSLQKLELNDNQLTAKALTALRSAVQKHPKLKEIIIQGVNIYESLLQTRGARVS